MKTFLVVVDPGDYSKMPQHTFLVKARDHNSAYNKFWKKCIHLPGVSQIFADVFINRDPQDDQPPYTKDDYRKYSGSDDSVVEYVGKRFGSVIIVVCDLDKYKNDEVSLVMIN